MSDPTVSVIIPAYKQAAFVGEAIRSVLTQTFNDLEAIVVDDCSPDETAEVVRQFSDPRLRYIAHDHNRMLAAARNTGIRAARGRILALLDADDYFGKEKLAQHVAYLDRNPQVGVTYNSRYELRCSDYGLRCMSRVPAAVSLGDLILGFPFTPSDMVLRRETAYEVDLFDERYVHFSEDLDINCRLALAGCRFAGIDRCLNYRRIHGGRVIRNPRQRLEGALKSLRTILADPRTPPAVHTLGNRAYANHYIVWGMEALRGGDSATGNEFLRAALGHEPGVLAGEPNELTQYLVYYAAADDTDDMAEIYRGMVAQLPPDFDSVQRQMAWGIGRAWLISAYRNLMWGTRQEGRLCLTEAARRAATCDEALVNEVVHQLLGVENEYGRAAAEDIARLLDEQFRSVLGQPPPGTFLYGLEIGRAYEYFNTGRYGAVPGQVLRAIRVNPRRGLNRGSLSILVRASTQGHRLQ